MFVATEQNLEALRIGYSAPSLALRMLQGSNQGAKETMKVIATKLSSHIASKHFIPLSPQILQVCINSYQRLKDEPGSDRDMYDMNGPPLAALVHACLDRRLDDTIVVANGNGAQNKVYTYLRHALQESTGKPYTNNHHLPCYWVESYELTSKPTEYGIDPDCAWVALAKTWCDDYLRASDPFFDSETPAFVAAISRVYETVAPHDPKRKCLPEAVYVILVFAASPLQSEEQFAACMGVLSRFSFPSLSTELVQYVTRIGNGSWSQLVGRLAWRAKHEDNPVKQHFSATQLWLLLHLVGDLTTDTQKRLSQLLEDEEYLEIKTKGFDQVKKDLETRILHYYQADRLDTYSARIIECIHESSGTRPDDPTKTIMDQKLKDVPQSHRGPSSHHPTTSVDPKLPSAIGHG
ncbi:hypothetical protein BN14_10179 [Rhizoctonia solani AG-1 IB]|uniref:Uncharacterized protein n=1 Tax=Thanatephorus cucumeris (strain AG1-IB / isolate 7/3/14) TaxID=1108050 RepID=M5CGG1_THACB|nr:hypothetical protein BN14_10179 [Rhizoctonia solani AG-1 IB]